MREYQFEQVDVFTDRIFGGNPLAVFSDAGGLDDDEMQAIAREMNLSETTFVFPPSDPEHLASVRIFTPHTELPFAGHPTIGTAWVLGQRGRLPDGSNVATLELKSGPVSVEFSGGTSDPDFLWMDQGQARFGRVVDDRASVATALSLTADDLAYAFPVQPVSTGLPFLIVPLTSKEAVDRAIPDSSAINAWLPTLRDRVRGFLIFAVDPEEPKAYSRMFAAIGSIWEDPATGSASGPLGAYLVQHGAVPNESGTVEIVNEQGTAMGRQSFISIRVAVNNGRAGNVRVGGSVVPVFTGQLKLP
ncbi:MAG: PhzF family phenazine biosynthesis protein [Chloroflexota bacterium]